ncbi:MAG: hypothetical protein JXA91_02785 [Candidatus Thermoplasmatota archaeon]|nr:hypothetical protein [Candidatus Thermoplasmatota archaeon]
MRKFTSFLVVMLFILLAVSSMVESRSLFLKNKESNFNPLDLASILKTRILSKLNIFKDLARYFSLDGSKDDSSRLFDFTPEDISLKDDAFHGSDFFHFTEWWYFDAAFNNGYSIQISIRIMDVFYKSIFLVFTRLDVYKDGELVTHNKEVSDIVSFHASDEEPFVLINKNMGIRGHPGEKEGLFDFYIFLEVGDIKTGLNFHSLTKGWKGETPGSKWVVAAPRAYVEGWIDLGDSRMEVEGIGYHDHNYDVTMLAMLNEGWFWGKINSENYTITWSNIMTTVLEEQPLAVININNGGYVNIEPENLEFNYDNYTYNNGKYIPTSLRLTAKQDNISFDVKMEVEGIHYVTLMGIVKYWRYHVKSVGFIEINDYREQIEEMHMAELVNFF